MKRFSVLVSSSRKIFLAAISAFRPNKVTAVIVVITYSARGNLENHEEERKMSRNSYFYRPLRLS